jgi:hypothetical protein
METINKGDQTKGMKKAQSTKEGCFEATVKSHEWVRCSIVYPHREEERVNQPPPIYFGYGAFLRVVRQQQ